MSKFFSRAASLFRNITRKGQVEQELKEELSSYVELLMQEKMKEGLNEPDARRAALVEAGGVEQVKEEVREVRAGFGLETWWRDLRFGWRSLGRSPGFTTAALLTLALGIGANTAIFSILDAVILRPLPYTRPAQLVKIWPAKKDVSVSKADFVEIKTAARSFDDIAAYSGWDFTLTGAGEPARLEGARTTASLFSLLGVNAAVGRAFVPEEDQPGHDKVVLLSYSLWQSRFGSNPQIVGQTIVLNGSSHTVIGVTPPGFTFPPGRPCELWVPAPLDPSDREDYSANYLTLLGRLHNGVTVPQAQAEVMAIARAIARERAAAAGDTAAQPSVASLQSDLVAGIRPMLFVLLGTAGIVLLIACANVANLQLARSSARQREMAIRAALGASRARLVRQLLTENLLLALLGGAAGTALAYLSLDSFVRLAPATLPRVGEIAVNLQVLIFSGAASLFAGVIFGLAPALQLAPGDLQAPLQEGGRTGGHGAGGRLRLALVTCEVALAFTLLISAGLLLKSFYRLSRVEPGFDAAQVLSLQLAPAEFPTVEQARSYYREVPTRLAAVPGVQSVGGIHLRPMGDSNWDPSLQVEDQPPDAAPQSVNWRLVTPDYFRAMGIPLRTGRGFAEADNENAPPVALVNEALARKYWPGDETPLGKRVHTGFEGKGNWATIVGVVGNVRQHGLREETRPEIYRPYFQHSFLPSMTVMIRGALPPAVLAPSVRDAIWSIDKNVPVTDLEPLSYVVERSIAEPRSTMILLTAFAAVGLALGIVGIYGVISYSVAQRTHEIGVRMALGASSADVVRLVLRQGWKLTAVGILLGLGGALAATRLLTSLLFEISPTDPATFILVAGLLAMVALFAAYLPARRASRANPLIALRCE